MDREDVLRCPKCGSIQVTYDREAEYTGGGYAEYWYEFYCEHCGNIWRSEKEYDYA